MSYAAGALVATITNWCGTLPVPMAQDKTASGGPWVVVVPLNSLDIQAGATLRVIGDRPLVLLVRTDTTVSGGCSRS